MSDKNDPSRNRPSRGDREDRKDGKQSRPGDRRRSSSRRRKKSVDPRHLREEGAFVVAVRNQALFLAYRRLALAALLSLVAAVVSVVAYLGVSGKPVPPQYIPVAADGRLLPLIPLNQPNVDDGVIGEFALKVVREANNYDYLGWKTQVARVQNYFTPAAWNRYFEEFSRTNIINTVVAKKMIVIARPSGSVEIENRGVLDSGIYVWRVAVPLEIQYVAHDDSAGQASAPLSSRGRVTLYIERVPTTQSPRGFAVRAYQYEQVQGR